MNESLVLASDGEHALRVRGKGSTHNVLAMTSVALWSMRVVNDRVAEDINETPIIAGDNQLAIRAHLHLVHVSTILSRRMHALNVPAELDSRGRPLQILRVGQARCILSLVCDVKVEFLIVSANRTNI